MAGNEYSALKLVYTWSGFYKAKAALTEMGGGEFIRGAFRDYAQNLLQGATSYAKSITHIWTGALADSHMWEYDSHKMKGSVFINPRSVHSFWYSPTGSATSSSGVRSGSVARWPFLYGPYEHARGDEHAFYKRTMDEYIEPQAIPGMKDITRRVDILWR